MQLKTILNSIEKHKSFAYGEARWSASKTQKEIEIPVKPRRNSKPICSECGKKRPGYDSLTERRFACVPLWAIPVFLVYALQRRIVPSAAWLSRGCPGPAASAR